MTKLTFELGPAFIEHFNEGDAVYLDTIVSGLVPGLVTKVEAATFNRPGGSVHVRVVANRYAYRKGEVVEVTPNGVVQRSWIRRRKHSTVVIVPPRPVRTEEGV